MVFAPSFTSGVGKEIKGFKEKESRKDLILRTKQEIKNLFTTEGKDTRPTLEDFEKYKTFATDIYYRNKEQAKESDHNIEHAATVFALSLGIAAYRSVAHEQFPIPCVYDSDAIAIGAFLHDSQRENDVKESVFDLQGHGKKAAEFIENNKHMFASLLGKKISDISIEKAKRICEFHDNEYRPDPENSCDELLVVAAADRATLPRILFSYHTIVASLGKLAGIYQGIVWRRATRYEIKDHKDLMQTFLPIGTLLCLLTREYVGNNFDFEHQCEAVKKAAVEIGLLRKDSSAKTS